MRIRTEVGWDRPPLPLLLPRATSSRAPGRAPVARRSRHARLSARGAARVAREPAREGRGRPPGRRGHWGALALAGAKSLSSVTESTGRRGSVHGPAGTCSSCCCCCGGGGGGAGGAGDSCRCGPRGRGPPRGDSVRRQGLSYYYSAGRLVRWRNPAVAPPSPRSSAAARPPPRPRSAGRPAERPAHPRPTTLVPGDPSG